MHFRFKPVIAADGDKRLWWSGPELLSSCLTGEVSRVAAMVVLQFSVGQGNKSF